jgi:hypothetical protein
MHPKFVFFIITIPNTKQSNLPIKLVIFTGTSPYINFSNLPTTTAKLYSTDFNFTEYNATNCDTVKPLFKKGDRTDVSNYTLTSFSKILEKVIYNRLLEHVINNILEKEEFGFRKNLTTEKATYELSNEIIGALDKKLLVVLLE